MNSATKLLAISVTATMMAAAIIVTEFLSSSTMPIQKASAQMMAQSSVSPIGPGMMGPGMMRNQNFTGMMMAFAAPNVTGSVSISSLIGNALSSQIKVGLSQATDAAEKAVGNNSHAVAAHIGEANGYLVYTVWLVDSSFNFHRAIVDAGNGKVLSSQQSPIRHGMMMGPGMMGMMNPSMMGPGMMGGFYR